MRPGCTAAEDGAGISAFARLAALKQKQQLILKERSNGGTAEQEIAVEARHAPLARALSNPPLALEPTTGEVHLRHHISPNGYYRGKKVVKTKGE